MNVRLLTYPYGQNRKNIIVPLVYLPDTRQDCPFFSKDGTLNVPEAKTYIRNIPLESGFSFSGFIFEEPSVDEVKEEVTIKVTKIILSRDGVLHPEIALGNIHDVLVEYGNS